MNHIFGVLNSLVDKPNLVTPIIQIDGKLFTQILDNNDLLFSKHI